jgi:hypothetical protein
VKIVAPVRNPAMVVATIALLVALGGTAVAVVGLNAKQKRQARNIANAAISQRADSLVVGRSSAIQPPSSCLPTGPAFRNCVTVSLDLPHRGRVLLVGATNAAVNGTATAAGDCRFGADSAVVGRTVHAFVSTNVQDVISHTAVSDPLPAGTHSFQFGCNETVGDIQFVRSEISAVLIGAG